MYIVICRGRLLQQLVRGPRPQYVFKLLQAVTEPLQAMQVNFTLQAFFSAADGGP